MSTLTAEKKPSGRTIVGDGAYTYEPVENWAKLPPGWSFKEIGGVGVDKNDNVYVFNRGQHPMIVFDRDGNFLRSFGEGLFPRAHGVFMAPDDTIWLTDDGDHTVRQCTLEGKVLLTLGISGKPAPYMSGEPFHRCTHTAMSPQGDIYVSDGYGNSRVHKYAPNGKLLLSWGGPGTDPGEFNIAHNITCDADGWVYVADRENHRVQVFDGNGKYETQWNNLHRPCGLFMPPGKCPICYIAGGGILYVGLVASSAENPAFSGNNKSCRPISYGLVLSSSLANALANWAALVLVTSAFEYSPRSAGRISRQLFQIKVLGRRRPRQGSAPEE